MTKWTAEKCYWFDIFETCYSNYNISPCYQLEGLKTMARWLLGLKADELSAQKTFRMLNALIVNQGDLLQQGRLR